MTILKMIDRLQDARWYLINKYIKKTEKSLAAINGAMSLLKTKKAETETALYEALTKKDEMK